MINAWLSRSLQPLAYAADIHPADHTSFCESGVQLAFYSVMWTFASIVGMRSEFFWETWRCWEWPFPNQPITYGTIAHALNLSLSLSCNMRINSNGHQLGNLVGLRATDGLVCTLYVRARVPRQAQARLLADARTPHRHAIAVIRQHDNWVCVCRSLRVRVTALLLLLPLARLISAGARSCVCVPVQILSHWDPGAHLDGHLRRVSSLDEDAAVL